MATRTGGVNALNRRAFLGGVLKLGAGGAALSLLGCEGLAPLGEEGHGHCGGVRPLDSGDPTRTAEPAELFAPLAPAMMLDEKWRLERIVRRPDTHLCVTLTDVQTGNPMDIEVFRGPDAKGRAIAATDHWEFYTYDADQAGRITPDHVVDAISQLALRLVGHENRSPFVRLNRTVCRFVDRDPGPQNGDPPGPAEQDG